MSTAFIALLIGVVLGKIIIALRKDRIGGKPYWQIQMEIEKEQAPMKQEMEDFRVEREIRRSALDAYLEWSAAKSKHEIFLWAHPEAKGFSLPFVHLTFFDMRGIGAYTIHDEATAKYKDVSIHNLINEEFNKLKKEHKDIFSTLNNTI